VFKSAVEVLFRALGLREGRLLQNLDMPVLA